MAGSDRGSYAKPLLVQALSSHLRCVSPNFRSETTFSKVAGGGAQTADLQTRRLALNPLLRRGTHKIHVLFWEMYHNDNYKLYFLSKFFSYN